MALSDRRLLSVPHRVLFAGFESTTTRLQQAGWELAAEELVYEDRIRLLMRHKGANLSLITRQVHYGFFDNGNPGDRLTFEVIKVASAMSVVLNEQQFVFRQIDAMPQYVNYEPRAIEDMGIFAAPLVRTEEIIVEPQSVAECLDLIRKMQAPQLAAVRKRNEQREAINQQRFHAQILSLAA